MNRNPSDGGAFRPTAFDDTPEKNPGAPGVGNADAAEEEGFTHLLGPTDVALAKDPKKTKAQAEYIVEQARREADELLAQARTQVASITEEARREGYDAGIAESRAKMTERADMVEKLLSELAAYKPSLLRGAKKHVVELTRCIVDRILGAIVEENPERIETVVERALSVLTERETVNVRVSPHDMHYILEAKPKLLATVDGIKNLTFIDDPAVERGGCMVETESTEIDARLRVQLDEIIHSLREVGDD